jgi:hypothetical protein
MRAESQLPPVSLPAVPGPLVRVEYLDFRDVGEHREFRLRVYGRDGSTEVRFVIPIAAFGAGGLSLQDGPDVCYQKLLRVVAAGETASPDVITIDDVDLAGYRQAHTHAPKHKSWASSSPVTPPLSPREPPRTPSPQHLAPRPGTSHPGSALKEGQRVSHAIFGVGVTTASNVNRTAVYFDEGGTKTFVTSMLVLDVLSEPHTWETSPRGTNRPCRVPAAK